MEEQGAIYLEYLDLKNVANFKDTFLIFANPETPEEPAFFTLIVGGNNTGKTSLLKILAGWETYQIHGEEEQNFAPMNFDYKKKYFNVKISFKRNESEVLEYACCCPNAEAEADQEPIYYRFTFFYENQKPSEIKILMDAYATNRKKGDLNLADYQLDTIEQRTKILFNDQTSLLNAISWIMNLAAANGIGDKIAGARLEKVKEIISLLFETLEDRPQSKDALYLSVENGHFVVLFETETGTKIPFQNLGTAYKSLITWVLDLAYRMFVRYPESAHPLEEPAMVLVDELDAHLHPQSQRRVVSFLRKVFPKTQFIATAQNPFLLQDSPDVNLMILKKEANSELITIEQLLKTSFEGWEIEKILKLLD
jgi:predicted ATP-dependent endonuclease of OLD family